MSETQETIIYIEQTDKDEAEFMSGRFVTPAIKKRAYINAIGAELILKYLASEGIEISDIHNLHSISKILEKIDISDIMLPNIHIDVRVVFDESKIFIPQSHFQYELTPDVYAVLKLSKDFSRVEFLGYFEPKIINVKNKNSEYYFIEQDKLSSPASFAKFVKDFNGSTSKEISPEDMLKGRMLYVSMADHNISDAEQKELFAMLISNDALRDSVLEFDNFETLSYTVCSATDLTKQKDESETLQQTQSSFEEFFGDENLSQNSEGDDLLTESTSDSVDNISEITDDDVPEFSEDGLFTNEEFDIDVLPEETVLSESENLKILEDNTKNNKSDNKNIIGDVADAAIAGAAAAGTAAVQAAETLEAGAAASNEAIKLAGVAGDLVNELVNKNLKEQHTNLDKIDYANSTVNDVADIPENISAYDLGAAKIEEDIKAEASGQFDTPKDLSELETVNLEPKGYNENIEQEVIDFDGMESVELEQIKEHADSIVDFENLSEVNSPTKPVEDLNEKMNADYGAIEMNLPNLSSYTINADGTSAVDNVDINLGLEEEREEDLLDLNNPIVINDETNELGEDLDLTANSALESLPFENEQEEHQSESSLVDNETSEDSMDLGESDIFDENMSLGLDEELITDTSELSLDGIDTSMVLENFEKEDKIADELERAQEEQENLSDDIEISDVKDDLEIKSENETPLQFEDITVDSLLDDIIPTDTVETQPSKEEIPAENKDENENTENLPDDLGLDDNADISLEEGQIEDLLPVEDVTNENIQQPVEETSVEDDFDFGSEDMLSEIENNEVTTEQETAQDISFETEQPVQDLEEEITDVPNIQETVEIAEEAQENKFAVTENSTVISDLSFKVGEIPIDINNTVVRDLEGPEQLEELYDENNTISDSGLLKNPGRMGRATERNGGKVGMMAGLGILGVFVALIIVGIVGVSVSKMLKQSKDETPQPITDDTVSTNEDISDANTLNVNENNVAKMDDYKSPAPVSAKQSETAQTASPTTKPARAIPASSFIEVRKLSWEVPDYVSYNASFRQYFQAVGKSLKLSLTSDLLLATEYSYSNQVRVSVVYDKDGNFKDAKILQSSGSSQIDKIVLQTVNQTLKVLKAPHSVGNDENTTVILKIFF